MLHCLSFEILREVGDIANVLGDKQACSRFNEVDGVAIGSVFDRVVLVLTQELETFIEFEAVSKDLDDLEIIGTDREREMRGRRCGFVGSPV
jgi:hypothetical protein